MNIGIRRSDASPRATDVCAEADILHEQGEAIVLQGYLRKRAIKSARNWQRRFFVLRATHLTYYKTDKDTNAPKGDIVLDSNCEIERKDVDEVEHCAVLSSTTGKQLYLASNDERELLRWISAISHVIENNSATRRGYLTKRAIGSGANWKRRFFVLGRHGISYFKDHDNTALAQRKGHFSLSPFSRVETINNDWELPEGAPESGFCFVVRTEGRPTGLPNASNLGILQEGVVATAATADGHAQTNGECMFMTAETPTEREEWVRALSDVVAALVAAFERGARPGDAAVLWDPGELALHYHFEKVGMLTKRAVVSGDNWKERWFTLEGSSLKYYADEYADMCKGEFTLTPDCTVYETTLRAYAFELVTSQKVLHAAAESDDARREWIEAIRANIRKSRPLHRDPIAAAADMLVTGMAAAEMYPNFSGEPMLYDIRLSEKRPLGITLAQHGEWAIVRLSHEDSLNIGVGSALASINGVDCQLGSYANTVSMLKGWRPPLHLVFRRAPSYRGFLWKQSRGQRVTSRILPGSVSNKWKMRYFILECGVLEYFTDDPTIATSVDGVEDSFKGDFGLVGAAITLVPHTEIGRFFCLRLRSGYGNLVLQAASHEEMMDWAAVFYHAIAVANGGGFLLERERMEREQNRQQEEMEAQLLALQSEAEEKERQLEAAREEVRLRAEEEAKAVSDHREATLQAKRANEAVAETQRRAEAARNAAASAMSRAHAVAEVEVEAQQAEEQARVQSELEAAARHVEESQKKRQAELERQTAEAEAAARESRNHADELELQVAETQFRSTVDQEHARRLYLKTSNMRRTLSNASAENAITARAQIELEQKEGSGGAVTTDELPAAAAAAPQLRSSRSSQSSRSSHPDSVGGRRSSAMVPMELTDVELAEAFQSIVGFSSGQALTPVVFGMMMRAVSSNPNVFEHTQTFHTLNTSGSGAMSEAEFVAGMRELQRTIGRGIGKGVKEYACGSMTTL